MQELTLFEEKLSLFQDMFGRVSKNIFRGTKPAYKLEVSTCRLFYEMSEVRTWPAAEIQTVKYRQEQDSYVTKLPQSSRAEIGDYIYIAHVLLSVH